MITKFEGEYRFLSNFYSSPIRVSLQDIEFIFPSVENAYQACKCAIPSDVKRFLDTSAGEAKKLGRKVEIRSDWNAIKLIIMEILVNTKFTTHADLRAKLIATGAQELREGNYWHDNFWGDCTCPKCKEIEGSNHLGKILMDLRGNYFPQARNQIGVIK